MRSTLTALLLFAATNPGCSKSSPDPGKEAPPKPTASSDAPSAPSPSKTTILERAKTSPESAPFAIVSTNQGIGVSDGVEVQVLAKTTSPNASGGYSVRDSLLWYQDGETLNVLDLRDADPKPVRVLEKVPSVGKMEIRRAQNGHSTYVGFETGNGSADDSLVLRWWDEVSLQGSSDVDHSATQIVGLPWLQKQAARAVETPGPTSWEKSIGYLPEDIELSVTCSVPEECAHVAFGASGWILYHTVRDCDDDTCLVACRLSDGETDKVASPAAQPAWEPYVDAPDVPATPEGKPGSCGPYYFDRAGKSYFTSTRDELCVVGAGCRKAPGRILSFVDAGPAIDLADPRGS